jgi:hypothetical protein
VCERAERAPVLEAKVEVDMNTKGKATCVKGLERKSGEKGKAREAEGVCKN